MKAIVVVTHGSRRKEFIDDLEKMSEALKGFDAEVILAHNEYSFPNWREVIKDLVARGYDRIVFALAFLGRGNHVFRDIAGSLGVEELETWKEVEVEGKRIQVYFTRPLADSPLVQAALKLRVLKALDLPYLDHDFEEDPEEIEERSMSLAEEEVKKVRPDLSGVELRIAARLVYTSGNPEVAKAFHFSKEAAQVALEAFKAGVTVIADVKMVEAGIRWPRKANALNFADKVQGKTLTAIGVRRAIESVEGLKAVAVGNAPTALLETLRAVKEGKEVSFVVATPPGFTNAAEVKEALIASGIPHFTVRGSLGGSNLAVAIVNELLRWVK
ncbi:MAG: precorrin-8X methylmutase [Thermoprotei archaeon]